ncbi:hypothetical protein [Sphingobium chungangianum]
MDEYITHPLRVLGWAAGSLLVFIAAVEAILCGPAILAGRKLVPLDSGDTIALMTGSITAAGLAALYAQIRESARAAKQARQAERKLAAAQADNLHVAFNQAEMHRSRDLAWRYLAHLEKQPTQLPVFAKSWVLGDARPRVPAPERKQSAPSYGITDFSHYIWSISNIIAFFVRLESHFAIHAAHVADERATPAVIAGPFFWSYWRTGLLAISEACDQVYNEAVEDAVREGKDPTRIVRPYFTDPLWALEALVSTPPLIRTVRPLELPAPSSGAA